MSEQDPSAASRVSTPVKDNEYEKPKPKRSKIKSISTTDRMSLKGKERIKKKVIEATTQKPIVEIPRDDLDLREHDFTFVEKTHLHNTVKEMTVPGKGIIDICEDIHDYRAFRKLPKRPTKLCGPKMAPMEDSRQRIFSLYLHATKQSNMWFYISGLLMQEDMVNFFAARKNIRALTDFNIKCGLKVGETTSLLPGSRGEPADVALDRLTEANILRYIELGIVFLQREINFRITKETPSVQGLRTSSEAGAMFCRTTQRHGLVPLLTLDIAVDHKVDEELCQRAYEEILAFLSWSFQMHRVYIEGVILQLKAIPYLKSAIVVEDNCNISFPDVNENQPLLPQPSSKTIASPSPQKKPRICEKNDSKCVHIPLETRNPLKGQAYIQMLQVNTKKNEGKLRQLYGDYRCRMSGRDPRVNVATRRSQLTAQAIMRGLPAGLGGLMLVGEAGLRASVAVLNEMNRCPAPRWPLHVSFCFRGVVQQGVVSRWAGRDELLGVATGMLVRQAKTCSLGTMGQAEEIPGSLWIHDALGEATGCECRKFLYM